MSENKIKFPVKLASNNPQSFGIADATEISGHRVVDTLSDLYVISDPILSILKDGSDAIGQEWFVVSEDCKYRLDNWENRKSIAGWTKLPKQELINGKQSISEKDQPSGYAGLDSNGKLPIEKTYGTTATVVDVETYESLPAIGLSGVIYYVSNTSAQYKWSGSAYIDITNGADNAKKNETSIFDCSNGTSTKYYSSLSNAINVVPPAYRTSNRIISYLSTESSPTSAVNYQYHGIDSTTWTDLTKWERIPNQADLADIRSDLSETITALEQEQIQGGVYDVSSHNDGAVFESISTLLGSANLSTLIPTSVRRGGMSIRFIQSSDNKYVQYRLMADEFTTNTTQWAIANEDVYVENPEFIYVKTDKDDKILWAIKADGGIYYGTGVPQQVVDYINNMIADLSLDEYEDIVTFLNGLEKGDKALKTLLNEKVDKEDGKSIIDADYASSQSVIENPEFLEATTDSEDKILEGIQTDGTKVIGRNLKVIGDMEVAGVSYKITENPEYLAAWVDVEGKVVFGLKTDGKTYVGDADFIDEIKNNQEAISELKTILGTISSTIESLDVNALSFITVIENSEFLEAKTDSEGKLLAGRTPDGEAFETVGFSTPKVSINGHAIENIEDPEGRSEIITDSEDKIISYRDNNGVKHENVGIETDYITLSNKGIKRLQENLRTPTIKNYNLPKFGYVDIISEVFYLTSDSRYSTKDDIEIRVDAEGGDSDENAANKVTVAHYYIKNTNVALDFYAASNVTKLNDKYYVTSSLTEVITPITEEITYEVNIDSIEVTQITDKPDVRTWPVDKDTEHYCRVSFDFGHYLTGTLYVGVKFQGSSTLAYRKRNFRFTFYKNNTYIKKDKIKIGEMLRLSGYNLKSNWTDIGRLKEQILYRVILDVWETRDTYDKYPWNKEQSTPYTGATGTIKGFPIRVSIGNEFWGLCIFGLKKDEKNYCLDGDDDSSGIFVSGEGGWTVNMWTDEMEAVEPMSQETTEALTAFFDFVNSGDFTRNNMPERMSIIDWIDYYICMQVFMMLDNTLRNMILYAGRDKKKFYPYFYDLDLSLGFDGTNTTVDIIENNPWGQSMTVWKKFRDAYWDEIVNRYCTLRNDVLSTEYIKAIYEDVVNNIPDGIFESENTKWNVQCNKNDFLTRLNYLSFRFDWLDKEYFKI